MLAGGSWDELAERLAGLGALAGPAPASPPRLLRQAADLVAAAAPAAAGSSAALWTGGSGQAWRLEAQAASHPDTARLDELELAGGAGPALSALAAGGTVDASDLLAEPRWPGYAAAALSGGVRAVRALARPTRAGWVTLTLHALRPYELAACDTAVGTLVLAQAVTALDNAELYGAVRRDAHQLAEAMRARAVIEQAKGVLMHAGGCDAEAAFAELRRRSQTANVRLAEIAARIVAEPALAGTDPPGSGAAGPPSGAGVPARQGGYRSGL